MAAGMASAVPASTAGAAGPSPDGTEYQVVVNHEEQYVVWPTGTKLPEKWKGVSEPGPLKSQLDAVAKLSGKDGDLRLRVVINHEEQYSLWPVAAAQPKGWKTKAYCTIDECAGTIRGLRKLKKD